LGAQPSIYAGVDIRGNAELGYESERKKLISTITYPGLSIKGIATVGPSLDLWGQLAGSITVSGNMKVGAKYTMDPIEMYMPNDDNTQQKASSKMEKFDKDQKGLSPVFQAGVKATVGVELRITPEINRDNLRHQSRRRDRAAQRASCSSAGRCVYEHNHLL
jgi:hypothetical protein